ncbi:MAG: DUF523 domain-containing protein [Deltaproteobacteria bacterium]|nr:MAG: DUF523 domain-containing protein [Deltaproteobacteria bacterium]
MDSLIVSACLLGRPCRYDGASKGSGAVARFAERWEGRVVAVCPEELGGLPTHRPAAELTGGDGHGVLEGRARVRRRVDGADCTAAFVGGAEAARAAAPDARRAILKARSPSCGCGRTWIDGRLVEGDGVFAALLRRHGIPIVTDEQLAAGAEEDP